MHNIPDIHQEPAWLEVFGLEGRRCQEFQGETRIIRPCLTFRPYALSSKPCSARSADYNQSVHVLTGELKRSAALGIPYVVTHVGSHKGKGIAYGIKRVTDACNIALKDADSNSMILLEITAGTKNSVGSTFEHLRQIIDGIRPNGRVGLCFDTCHAFAAGYDISRKEGIERTIKLLDEIIGLERVKAVHANDSKGPLGSGLDRHEHIGLGYIGEKGFRELFSHKYFKELPMVLETPIDARRDDVGNIKKLRQICS